MGFTLAIEGAIGLTSEKEIDKSRTKCLALCGRCGAAWAAEAFDHFDRVLKTEGTRSRVGLL